MKKHLFYLLLFSAQIPFAQNPCDMGIYNTNYSSGPIHQNISTTGALLFNDTGDAAYNFQRDGQTIPLIYTAAPWVGGITENGEFRFSGAGYIHNLSNSDWVPGPIHHISNPPGNCQKWDKTFTVSRKNILDAIALLYNADGSINPDMCNQLPNEILAWPGEGNPHFFAIHGTTAENFNIVLFYDHNEDGVYDPCDGDLPAFYTRHFSVLSKEDVLATFPDMLALNIINDAMGIQKLTPGEAMNMELHQYTFDYHTQDSLEQTTFQMFKIINKGEETLNDFYFSLWLDADLGCYKDDFTGTTAAHDMVYFYNADAVDGQPGTFCDGLLGFQEEVPLLGISYLDGLDYVDTTPDPPVWVNSGLTSSIYLSNCSVMPSNPFSCDPVGIDSSFYHKMTGKWTSTIPITKGGIGFNPESTDTTKYVFHNSPSDPNGWSMCSAGILPQDLRMLMSTGASKIRPGAIDEVIAAIQIVNSVQLPCPDIKPLIDVNKAAHNFKNRGWRRKSDTSAVKEFNYPSLPWTYLPSERGFTLHTSDFSAEIMVSDISGKILSRHQSPPFSTFEWECDHSAWQLVLVQVSSGTMSYTYKLVVK
ncbi:MAG: hypothetical protein IPN29_06685 [Saprospiraceae bacterium]|nr:hypothetical protein [Saprospiraceae bacterium]